MVWFQAPAVPMGVVAAFKGFLGVDLGRRVPAQFERLQAGAEALDVGEFEEEDLGVQVFEVRAGAFLLCG